MLITMNTKLHPTSDVLYATTMDPSAEQKNGNHLSDNNGKILRLTRAVCPQQKNSFYHFFTDCGVIVKTISDFIIVGFGGKYIGKSTPLFGKQSIS